MTDTYFKAEDEKKGIGIIDEWWNDDLTCAGKPTCCIEECDLCVDCFNRLKSAIQLKLKERKLKLEKEIDKIETIEDKEAKDEDWFNAFRDINNIPVSELTELQKLIKITILKAKLTQAEADKKLFLELIEDLYSKLKQEVWGKSGDGVCEVIEKFLKQNLEEAI
jgi:hypothetical protein